MTETKHDKTTADPSGWRPIDTAPENVRAMAAVMPGKVGQLRYRVCTPDGVEFFALWTGPSHDDPVEAWLQLPTPPR